LASGKNIEILPILTGSMHGYMAGQKYMEDEEIMSITESFQEILNVYGKPYIIISGADLAHIGAQFGDTYSLNFLTLNQSKDKDEAILNRIRDVDASGFFNTIQDEKDVRRICGLTPIYFQLNLLSGSQCEIVSYKQWTDGKSSVSFAGGVFYKSK
jgi:AmmeMemoRadiSam system protein B